MDSGEGSASESDSSHSDGEKDDEEEEDGEDGMQRVSTVAVLSGLEEKCVFVCRAP